MEIGGEVTSRSRVILEMTDTSSKYIKLRVVGEDFGEMHFGVKKTTPLNKLMRRYSESKGRVHK